MSEIMRAENVGARGGVGKGKSRALARCSKRSLANTPTAIDGEHLAGGEARAVAHEIHCRCVEVRGLADASAVISQHPIALQLRFLQTLTEVASENYSTTIFPLPVDLITPFLKSPPKP